MATTTIRCFVSLSAGSDIVTLTPGNAGNNGISLASPNVIEDMQLVASAPINATRFIKGSLNTTSLQLQEPWSGANLTNVEVRISTSGAAVANLTQAVRDLINTKAAEGAALTASVTAAQASADAAAQSAGSIGSQLNNLNVQVQAATGAVAAVAASATTATNKAGEAATSATVAGQQAVAAASSATAASTSAQSLAAKLVAFNATFVGDLAVDPTVDGSGNALMIGAEYFNTTRNILRVYTSAGWKDYDATSQTASSNAALSATSAAGSAGTATAQATVAAQQAVIATTQAGIATTQAGIATTQATAAATSAATALNAPGTIATSASSLTISSAAQTLTIQAAKTIVAGMFVQIASTASPTNWMHGVVTAYVSATGVLSVTPDQINGSGTFAAWTVSLSGPVAQPMADFGLPTLRPTLSFNFTGSGDVIDPRITFSRASAAMRFNALGQYEAVAAGVPRIDYDPVTGQCKGLLIEGPGTNIQLYSDLGADAPNYTQGVSQARAVSVAPDGSNTVRRVMQDTSTGMHRYGVGPSWTGDGVSLLYYSCFVRPFGNVINLNLSGDANSGAGVTVNFQTLTATNGGFIKRLQNGWYWVGHTGVAAAGPSRYTMVYMYDSAGNSVFAGDGVSGFDLWGMSTSTTSGSYVSNGATQVTRAADVVSLAGPVFTKSISPAAGTFYVEADGWYNSATASPMFQIDNGASVGNRYVLYFTGTNSVVFYTEPGGVGPTFTGLDVTQVNKFAAAFDALGIAASVNAQTAKSAVATLPVGLSRVGIGQTIGNAYLGGHIRRFAYYPARLTDAQLQALTS